MTNNTLWEKLCSYDNLLLAFKKARKSKTTKEYVQEFEKGIEWNILELRAELLLHSYRPQPLKTFILRDPKTRKISKSAFRDRIIHHALCNVIGPLFEKQFIYDSYANRKGKGTLKAIQRFEDFSRKVTKNDSSQGYVLKADIYHYFANVFLHELDFFVKQRLGVDYYLCYVDDFVLFHQKKMVLALWKEEIDMFLKEKLVLILHPQKSRVIPLSRGVDFLGFKIFPCHKLMIKKNKRTFFKKFSSFCQAYEQREIVYDKIYDFLEGWLAYAKQANTYFLRQAILKKVEEKFNHEISSKEINRYDHPSSP